VATASTLALVPPADASTELVAEAPAPSSRAASLAPATSQAGDDGLLTGAVKKTGASIARGGAKTGASLVDVFRTVHGAVRRALPY
jgi:hypothetical protein